MPDPLPDRRDRERKLADELATLLLLRRSDWQAGLHSIQLARDLGDTLALTLAGAYSDSAHATALGLGFDLDPSGAARGWADLYGQSMGRNLTDKVLAYTNPNAVRADVLAARVDAIVSPERWATLAATEVTRAATAGQEFAAALTLVSLGRTVGSLWHTAGDDKVCPICDPLDGTTRDVWEAFAGLGPPIHPNCVLPSQPVSVPGTLLGASKAFFDGPCVAIRSVSGRRLAVTENHPVLTQRGWLAAKLVRQGDYVFNSANPERIAAVVRPHDNHRPAFIEQMFCSLGEPLGMATDHVPVTAKDFHGDARFIHGHVDVVNPVGLLHRHGQTGRKQGVGQPSFIGSDSCLHSFSTSGAKNLFRHTDHSPASCVMCGRQHRRPFGFRGTRPSGGHRRRAATKFYASGLHSLAERSARHPKLHSQSLFAFAGTIPANDGIQIRNLEAVSAGAQFDAGLGKEHAQATRSNATLGREFVHRFAGLISLDQVADVSQLRFRGHVYDLQSSPFELYFCNGIIVHNCRCFLEYMLN